MLISAGLNLVEIGMITNLQILRAFAALAVVFYHTGHTINGLHTEFQGVAIFFCISGFMMTYVSRKSGDNFLTNRLIRIVPIYWVATISFFFWANSGLSNPPYTWPIVWDILLHRPRALFGWLFNNLNLTWASAAAIAKSLFFIPYKDGAGDMHPLLGVGWTLNMEMFFYVVFGLALKINKLVAPILAGSVLVAIEWLSTGGMATDTIVFYAGENARYFVLGIVCYYLWNAAPVVAEKNSRALLALALAGVTFFFAWHISPSVQMLVSTIYPYMPLMVHNYLPPTILLVALVCHSSGLRATSKFGLLLGGASYSLYLFHLFVMETMRPVGDKWPIFNTKESLAGMLFAMALSSALAVLIYKTIEIPLMKLFSRLLLPPAKLSVLPSELSPSS